tara:strand:- start:1378 stop:2241 length:864 start_codon:yes stop_codon:yes gene_type:complete
MAEEYYTVDAEISATQLDKICYPLTLLTLTYLSVNIYYWDTVFQHDFSQLLVIVTNGFAIFPIIVARGIFLKAMLLGAMITSFWAHMQWEDFEVPGHDSGRWDNAFASSVIAAYCASWWPDHLDCRCFTESCADNTPRFVRNCFCSPPKHQNSCQLRLTFKLFLQFVVTGTVFGTVLALYNTDNWNWFEIANVSVSVVEFLVMLFVLIALVGSLSYYCNGGKMITSMGRFVFYVLVGAFLGVYAFVSKRIDSDIPDATHSIWHVCIFISAYSISRAHSYVKWGKERY